MPVQTQFEIGDIVETIPQYHDSVTCWGSSYGFGWRDIIERMDEYACYIRLLENYVYSNPPFAGLPASRGDCNWIRHFNLQHSSAPRKKTKKSGFASFISKLS